MAGRGWLGAAAWACDTWSCRHLRERANERALGEGDLERVVSLRPCRGKRGGGGGAEGLLRRLLADEESLRLARAPWLGGDTAQSDARVANRAAVHLDRDGRR